MMSNKNKNVYLRLIGYLSGYKRYVFTGYGAMIAASLINLLLPQVVKNAIDQGLAAGNMDSVIRSASLILLIAVVRGVAAFSQRYCGEWLTYRVAYDLRKDFFDAIQLVPISFHDVAHTLSLIHISEPTRPY